MLFASTLSNIRPETKETYYQFDHHWTADKVIRSCIKSRLYYVTSWLAKQSLWQVYIPLPEEANHQHYEVKNPDEQHQFDLLYVPHSVIERITYKDS